MSTAKGCSQVHCRATTLSEDRNVSKQRGDEHSQYRAKRHETKKGFCFSVVVSSMLPPQSLGLSCCNKPLTKRAHEDYDAQLLHITHVWIGSYHNGKSIMQWTWSTEGWWSTNDSVRALPQWRSTVSANHFGDWKGQQVTILTQSRFTISLKMENNFQVPILHKTSLHISRMDHGVLKLW